VRDTLSPPPPLSLSLSLKTLIGVKESDTGLSPPSQWDLVQDKQMMQEEEPLHVARCTKIINGGQEDAMYMITVPQVGVCVCVFLIFNFRI
jgi:26S proteasome regulatory subunit T1